MNISMIWTFGDKGEIMAKDKGPGFKTRMDRITTWHGRDIGNVTPVAPNPTGNGGTFRAFLKDGKIDSPGLLGDMLRTGDKWRQIVQKAETREAKEKARADFLREVEKLKKARAKLLIDKITTRAKEHRNQQIYSDVPEAMQLDALKLKRLELGAALYSEDEAKAKILKAREKREYDPDALLIWASKGPDAARLARQLMDDIPPHLADPAGMQMVDELDALRAAAGGMVPYTSRGMAMTANALELLNDPEYRQAPSGPITAADLGPALAIEKRNREEKERAEEMDEIRKLRAELEQQAAKGRKKEPA